MNQTINLAYGQGNTLVHVAERIAAELGVEPDMTIAPSLLGEVTHYVADLSKARGLLGYDPQVPLDEGIARAVAWFREHREAHPEENVPVTADHEGSSPDDVEHGWKTVRRSLDVLAIFGPTASGKSAVAEAIAERIPAELVSADSMQVYRGLPILTNQDAGARLVGIWPLDRQGTVGEFQALAHEAIDEIVAGGPNRCRRRRLRSVVSGGVDRRAPAAGRACGRASALGAALRPARGGRPPTGCCRPAIPVPPLRCTRTTASASCGPWSSGRPAERSCRSDRASGAPSCACRPLSRA